MTDSGQADHEGPDLSADIALLQGQLDAYYSELQGLPSAEADAALLRLAVMMAWGCGARGRLGRTGSRSAARFLTKEIDPFLSMLERQGRLVERAMALRRAART